MYIIAIGVAMLTSCSEDDSVIVPETNQAVVLLKQTINSNGRVTNYTYDGNKLISKIDNQGRSTVYTYVGDLLTRKDDTYSGGGSPYTSYTELEYNTNHQLIQYITYPSNTFNVERVELVYYDNNSGNSVDFEKHVFLGDEISQLFAESSREFYLQGGNIVKSNSDSAILEYIYTHDDKNAPMKNIFTIGVFQFVETSEYDKQWYFESNIVSFTYASQLLVDYSTVLTYTYNTDNYPESSTTIHQQGTVNEWTEMIQYIYE